MNRSRLGIASVVVAVVCLGCWTAASGATLYNRAAGWKTGFTPGSSAGNPVDGMWKYEYVSSGDGLAGADPWWDNSGTLSLWENDWYGQPNGVWDRAHYTNPPIQQNALTHTIDGGNWPHRPRVSWISPGENIVSVTGPLSASWGGGATQDLEIAIGKISGKSHTLLWSGTVKQAGPTSVDLTPVRELKHIDLSAGDQLVWTSRAVAAQAGWVPLTDSGMNLTATSMPLGQGKLMGYWSFDNPGNLGRDRSGNNNHGTVNEAVSSGNVPAQIGSGQSLSFDGVNDNVWVPGITGPMGAFTVAFWLNPATHTNYNQQVGTDNWSRFVFHTTNAGEVYVGTESSGGSRFTPAELPAGTVELNQWQHYAFTFDNGTASFYKNGTRLAYKTGMDIPSDWVGFLIGKTNSGTINGLVDDVAIWDGALHRKTVNALAQGWISPADGYATAVLNDNPMGYWRLDDAPGSTVARDMTGSHDGVYSGSVTLGIERPLLAGGTNTVADFSGGSMRADTIDGLRDNFSVEFWINPDSHTNYNQSLGADSGWNQFVFHTGNNGEIWVGTGCCGGDRRFHNGDLPAGTLELDTWQHFVFTFEEVDATQGLARFYKNGDLLAERNLLKGAAWTGFNLNTNLDGLLDEVAVYNYALSAGQIMAHFEAAVPEPSSLALGVLGLACLALGGRRVRRRAG